MDIETTIWTALKGVSYRERGHFCELFQWNFERFKEEYVFTINL